MGYCTLYYRQSCNQQTRRIVIFMATFNPFNLEGKTILVTGASSGIGKATAINAAKLGATLIITARDATRLQETFDALEGQGVREHKQIIADLDYAIENLRGYKRPSNAEKIENKTLVNQNVAFGLRARANLIMGKYAEAAADADSAAVGYKPYSMSAVSTPAFCSLKDANWIWGIDVTPQMTNDYGRYPTPASPAPRRRWA